MTGETASTIASDYYEKLYQLPFSSSGREGLRLRSECGSEIRGAAGQGPSPTPGEESPYRNRPVEENLDLFRRMRAGEFPGQRAHVLRAKIDMASPNLHMRDPVMYRIHRTHHYRTGD